MARILKGVSERCISGSYSYHDEEYVDRVRRGYAERPGLSERFRERVRGIHDEIRDSHAYRYAVAASRKLRNVGREDRIEQLFDIGSLQHARKKMRAVIMADRVVRRARSRRMIEGFMDDFQWRDTMLNDHSELLFRQLNNGLVQEDDDGRLYATTYYLEPEDAKEYTKYDRGEALITQRHVARLIKSGEGEDPTSKYNACLSAFYA